MSEKEQQLRDLVDNVQEKIAAIEPVPTAFDVVIALLHIAITTAAQMMPEPNLGVLLLEKSRSVYAGLLAEQDPPPQENSLIIE